MSSNIEKDGTQTRHIERVHAVERVHEDGTVDMIDTHAIGGDLEEMPKGYFYSFQFLGTVLVSNPNCRTPTPGTRVSDLTLMYSAGCLLRQYLRVSGLGASRQHSVSIF